MTVGSDVKNFDVTAGNNQTLAGISVLGTQIPSQFDNALRALMSLMKYDKLDMAGAVTSTGTNSIVVAMSSAATLDSLYDGLRVKFRAGNTTTSATVTLAAGGLAATTVRKGVNGTSTALAIGDIKQGGYYECVYRSAWTAFELISHEYLHPALSSIAGLTTAADRMLYTTASNTYAVATLTSFARTLLDDTTATAALATLGAPALAAANTFTAAQRIAGTSASLFFDETDAAANNQVWRVFVSGEAFRLTVLDDAETTENSFIRAQRTGTTIDSLELLATSVTKNASEVYARSDIASQATAEAGTDDDSIMTALKVDYAIRANGLKFVTSEAVAGGSSSSVLTGIPSNAKRVIVVCQNFSSNSTSDFLVQIGDSGGIETTSYSSSSSDNAASSTSTTGFIIRGNTTAAVNAIMIIHKISGAGSITVVQSHSGDIAGSNGICGGGIKGTTTVIDRVQVSTTAGNFDSGGVYVWYE